ncbi:MAG: S-layer protein domain-containing protein [Candidatus Methanoperedens sp.]|nr:S-layer protein domain-containing protein [Candidatus Methanoperedens sp.]
MDDVSGFALVSIFVIVFLVCSGQAAAPVSLPESRFVWEPGENLTFTWTNENFDEFYYDAEKSAGKESLTIKLDNIKDRSIPENGIVYSTTVETVTATYGPFGEYAVIGFGGEKYLAGYPEGKSNITSKRGISLNLLQYISKDDDASYTLVKGGSLFLSGYVLEVRDVDAAGSQVTLSLSWEGSEVDTDTIDAGKKYMVRNNGFAELLISHGGFAYEKKTLGIGYNEFSGETWELGEGYTLTAPSVNYSKDPRKARLVLKRNGVELDDVWLTEKEVYRYTPTKENEMPKLITYLDACFAGATQDMIQFRYTWFVSDNVTQIKEGNRLGIFNVTVVEPDRMVLKNMVPIDMKAGSSINLLGNLSFFVENSDELRFYPTNIAGMQVKPEGVTENAVLETPDITTPAGTSHAAGKTERIPGFESVLAITILLVFYIIGRKRR